MTSRPSSGPSARAEKVIFPTGTSNNEQGLPVAEACPHIGRRHPERLLLDPIDDAPLLLVAMRRALKQRHTKGNQIVGRPTEEAPQREGQLHVVDHRRSTEAGRPARADAEAASKRVMGVF